MTATRRDFEAMISLMVYQAERDGRKPLCLRMCRKMWREITDAYRQFSVHDPSLKMPQDGRLGEYLGLPVFEMATFGVALHHAPA